MKARPLKQLPPSTTIVVHEKEIEVRFPPPSSNPGRSTYVLFSDGKGFLEIRACL